VEKAEAEHDGFIKTQKIIFYFNKKTKNTAERKQILQINPKQ
jgi:hypothetical protein